MTITKKDKQLTDWVKPQSSLLTEYGYITHQQWMDKEVIRIGKSLCCVKTRDNEIALFKRSQ